MNRGLIGALCLSVTFALLAGCGAPQDQTAGVSAVPRSAIYNRKSPVSGVRQHPSGGALLYATTRSSILMLSYPDGVITGTINKDRGLFLCSNSANGDVFVLSDSVIYQYAHGAKKPKNTLMEPRSLYDFQGCAVNPLNGDLAVTNTQPNTTKLLVFPGGSGKPELYTDPNVSYFLFCGYDNSENLFLDGYEPAKNVLAELPAGSGTLQDISLGVQVDGTVQWDGEHITVENTTPPIIYQLAISGSNATVIGTTKIRNQTKTKNTPEALTYIYDNVVIASEGKGNRRIGYWDYPAGGKPTQVLSGLLRKNNHFLSLAVSP